MAIKGYVTAAILGILFLLGLLTSKRWLFWQQRPPSIILVTIDTLRADRLGAYGNESGLTPSLDRLAEDGLVFTRMSSNVPLTLPSHASIMTGRYPHFHGVRDNGDFILPSSIPTIADRLRTRGYRTAAFVGSYVLASRFGLGRGFDIYDEKFGVSNRMSQAVEAPERRADQVVGAALRWLENQGEDAFFCWIHLNDPHTPYDPPEPYRSEYVKHLYDGEVAFTDAALNTVFDTIRHKGWYDRVAIIVTSDHGESLGEHGEATHGYFIYESTVHVPLIIKLPRSRFAGKRIDVPATLVDLAPTMLGLSGYSGSGVSEFDGIDLVPVIKGSSTIRPIYAESYYARLNLGWSELRSVRVGPWKYIQAPVAELYELDRDPMESNNVLPLEQARATELRKQLLSLEAGSTASVHSARAETIESSAIAKLQSLGYLAGKLDSSFAAGGTLPDPKEKLSLYQQMAAAQEFVAEGNLDLAANAFGQLSRSDPKIALAHHQRGMCYLALGHSSKAADEFERTLQLNSQFLAAWFDLGIARLQMRRFQGSLTCFQHVLRASPNDFEALYYMAVALSEMGLDKQAKDSFRRSIAIQPAFGEAYFGLGRLEIRRNDYAAALDAFRKAEQNGFSSPQFHAEFGWLLVECKQISAGLKQYSLALSLNPNDPVVHNNLAVALTRTGDVKSAIEHYQRALKLDPSYDEARINLKSALKVLTEN